MTVGGAINRLNKILSHPRRRRWQQQCFRLLSSNNGDTNSSNNSADTNAVVPPYDSHISSNDSKTKHNNHDCIHHNDGRQSRRRRRIVITGIGAVTPLGSTFDQSWTNLITNHYQSVSSGESSLQSNVGGGIVSLEEALLRQKLPEAMLAIESKIAKQLPCQVAAPAHSSFNQPYNHRMNRFIQLALHASNEALTQAGLTTWFGTSNSNDNTDNDNYNTNDPIYQYRRSRCGVCIGNAMSSVRTIFHTTSNVLKGGYRKINPYFVTNCLANSAAAQVAIRYQLNGPNHTVSTACAAGGHSIGDAYNFLMNESTNVDVMVCGGTESCIDPISMGGFCRLNAMSTLYNDTPHLASRPFDLDRDGFVMAEGSAILVLEDLDHALRRKAPIIYGEITGYSLTGDAFHITSPDPSYRAAQLCMKQAIDQHYNSNDSSDMIGYVNAHATSTPVGDEIEAKCIYDTMMQNSNDINWNRTIESPVVYVSSTKGSTGHLLGAAGAFEAACTINALRTQIIPPTSNLNAIDPKCQFECTTIQHVANDPIRLYKQTIHNDNEQKISLEVAMSNSFGFGGTNSCLVFKRYHPNDDGDDDQQS